MFRSKEGSGYPSYGKAVITVKSGRFTASFEVVLVNLRTELILGKPFGRTSRSARTTSEVGVMVHTRSGRRYLACRPFARRSLRSMNLQIRMIGERQVKKD